MLAFIGLGFFFYKRIELDRQRISVSAETLCPHAGSTAYHAFYIDATDSFNPLQRSELRKDLLRLTTSVREYARIAIYSSSSVSSDGVPVPLFAKCRPPDGSTTSSTTGNPRLIRQRYETLYERPLIHALDSALTSKPADRSPIMSHLRALATDAFEDTAGPGRLYLVSDLLHHTADYSHYRDSHVFEDFEQSAAFSRFLADFNDVDVTAFYVARDGATNLQNRKHVLFWENYFSYMGGRLVRVERIGS